MISRPVYATREDIKQALDFKETARADDRIDRALEAASESVDDQCNRNEFAPTVLTRYFDWPSGQYARPWRLWFDASSLIAVTSVSSGGVVVDPGTVLLEPNRTGPPYNRIELNIGTSSGWTGGNTHQRDIAITGLWGYTNNESLLGATVTALDDTARQVTVDAATSGNIGVGSLLRLDTERLLVVGRRQADTGQTLTAAVDGQAKTTTIPIADGDQVAVGETILIDGERMYVVDIAGSNLIVRRSWDGSTLAPHDTGATVWAPRRLTVQRGALGTTAAAHDTGTTVARWDPPALVRTLSIAETVTTLSQEPAGYGRVARTNGGGTSSGTGPRPVTSTIDDIRQQCVATHGRKLRMRAV